MVSKIQNYHLALTDYINHTLGLPFVWGQRDCVTYAIGAVEAMIGRPLSEKPEFSYTTREEALAFSQEWQMEAGMMTYYGAYEVPRNFQQSGDLIISHRDGLECVHVVFDRRVYAPFLDDVVRACSLRMLYELYPDTKLLRF